MTPKRFKAVCTETGREFGVFDLTRSVVSMPISRDGKAKWFSWGRIDVYEDIEDFTSKYNPELCQSTGLTDGRGQEVFFDDILVDPSRHMQSFVVMFDADMVCAKLKTTPNSAWVQPMMDVKNMFVIGNKWMPQAELQAMAEAVSNG